MTRSADPPSHATAFWSTGAGTGELSRSPLPKPGSGQALVRTVHSGISAGTESLVFRGEVPHSIVDQMRAPFQEGSFGEPVKYGYLNVGAIAAIGTPVASLHSGDGANPLRVGQLVFAHFPHQDWYVAPLDALWPLPDDLPAVRGVLAGTMETAINAVWDAAPLWGQRIAVIGAGLIGTTTAHLLRQFPLEDLLVVDPNEERGRLAESCGLSWCQPSDIRGHFDTVLHCSGSGAGLALALSALRPEGTVIEMSWFGAAAPAVPLGEHFHARRLAIKASQVSQVSPRVRATRAERMRLAMEELRKPTYDALVTEHSPFSALPLTMKAVAAGTVRGMCHVVDYPTEDPAANDIPATR